MLGYIQIEEKDGAFSGAALVTDYRGIPMDFRYTEPVRPTRLERILYGQALDIYLREEVILQSLLSAVEAKPQLWMTVDIELIKPVQQLTRLAVLFIEQTSHAPLEQIGQTQPQMEENSFLLQVDNISSPMRISLSAENVSKLPSLTQNLVDAAVEMEIMEPFSRMSRALEAVSDNKGH